MLNKNTIRLPFFFAATVALTGIGNAAAPNVIWIISDDCGPELGCYDYADVSTPHLDRLAAEGIRYTAAFATAPVCSSSRTAFQTGRYQTSVGGHHHNTRDKKPLPESVTTVTERMQQAGYFVCNGNGYPSKRMAKSHLNFQYKATEFFDGVDWSEREPGQPFFAQVQIKEPHRPFVIRQRDHEQAEIPPYYPDHPITRADWSNYLASVEAMDAKVGDILGRLEQENLLDKTLVIFFGDHGRPHVRGKQWLYDGGLHVPLIMRLPNAKHAGEVRGELVSLLDPMPTTLGIAGVNEPGLPGLDLLSEDWKGHTHLIAARDRCGDAVDRIRSVRDQRWKYIHNFHPERPYMQHSGYKKLSYPVVTLMNVLHAQGRWDAPFMAKQRPKEELYDLQSDPHELNNLASDPGHLTELTRLRGILNTWIESTGDQGAIDESLNVDMDALMVEKRAYYERGMKRRGLDPNLSDEEYLRWWREDLGLVEEPTKSVAQPAGVAE